jgi:hypothetical protein
MPLADYYQRSPEAIETFKKFKEQEGMPQLIALGNKPKWELAQPPFVYTMWGREMTQTVWRDTTGGYPRPVKIVLEYLQSPSSDKAQWKVELVSDYIDGSDRL